MAEKTQDMFSPKSVAVFGAVMELVQQGVQMYKITVQQIADTAKIGKGTLYEYFSSREEMLAKSVIYYMWQNVCGMENAVRACESYDGKLSALFTFTHEAASLHSTSFSLIASSMREKGMQNAIKALTKDRENLENRIGLLLDEIVQAGINEKKANKTNSKYSRLVLNAMLFACISSENTYKQSGWNALCDDIICATKKALK